MKKATVEVFKIAFQAKTAQKKILKHLKTLNEKKGIKYYAVTYVDDKKLGEAFAEELSGVLNKEPEFITKSSGVIAMGAGKGAVAVAYITE